MQATISRTLVFFLVLIFAASALTSSPAAAVLPESDLPGTPYKLQGSVVEKAGVANALVSLTKADGSLVGNTTTDATGNYAYVNLAAGTYTVSAGHACCLRRSVEASVHGLNMTHQAPPIVLERTPELQTGSGVRLAGTVKDTATSKGVANVALEVQNYFGSDCKEGQACTMYMQTQYFMVETNAEGKFELQVNKGSVYITARHSGYDTTTGSVNTDNDTTVNIPLRAAQTTQAILTGVLRDTSGKPIGQVWVNAGPDYSYSYGCPPDADCVGMASPAMMPMEPSSSPDGQWMYASNEQSWNSTQTASDGSWTMRIAPGRLQVSAYAQDYVETHKVVDAPGGQTTNVDLVMQPIPPDSVTIKGHVTDAGEPLPGATVSVENQLWGTWASATTDEDGFYEIKTKPGYSIVTFAAYRYWYVQCYAPEPTYASDDYAGTTYATPGTAGPTSGYAVQAPCPSGERDQDYLPVVRSFAPVEGDAKTMDVSLRAKPGPTAAFEGYVLNSTTGQVVKGASVSFSNEMTHDWGNAVTDANGSYRIKVYPGYYTVRVWAEGYFDGVLNVDLKDKETKRLDIMLTSGMKRYGYATVMAQGVRSYDAVYEGGASPATGSPMAAKSGSGGATMGTQAFYPEAQGLGPYHPQGGSSPSLAGAFAAAALVAVVLLRRRDD